MKIGIVCPYSLARGGGVQEHVLALAAGLNKRGHTALIITQRPTEYKNRSKKGVIFLGGGVDIHTTFQTSNQITASITTEEIDEVLSREDFDLLHFHEPELPFLSRQILSRSSAVNVGTFHSKVLETLMVKTVLKVVTPYTKSILGYIDTLTAVSPAAADYVSTLTDRPILFVPNGIDLKRYHVPRHPDDADKSGPKTILYVGRLEKRKGVKYLLRAFQLVSQAQPDASLLIAGDGPDRAKLEQYAVELGLTNVKFLGFVSESKKVNLLHSSDLFVSPALYGESFGIVLLEAMASGLPTVASDNLGYSQLMQGLGSLSLVNVQDALEFSRRIELLLAEPTLRKLWRKWASEYVKQYNYDNIIDQYEVVYEQALAQHGNKKKQIALDYAKVEQA